MKARNLTKEQVIHDVLLQAQPTKEFRDFGASRSARAVPVRDDAAQITGAICRSTAAGPRSRGTF